MNSKIMTASDTGSTDAPSVRHRILFICLGNICRSVTAEEIFRTMVVRAGRTDEFSVDSAGLIDYHEGELADARMRRHAAAHGYELTHRSRPVTQSDFYRFDLVVAMDEDNVRRLRRLAPDDATAGRIVRMTDYLRHHKGQACIPDPYYGGEADFELVIELLEDACGGLLEALS